MEGKKSIKLVRSSFENVRIHDRRTFDSVRKDAELVKKLQQSVQQKEITKKTALDAQKVAEQKDVPPAKGLKLKIKLAKQEIPKYDVRKVKEIINNIDDELLAMIVMHADSEKVMNGLRMLGEG